MEYESEERLSSDTGFGRSRTLKAVNLIGLSVVSKFLRVIFTILGNGLAWWNGLLYSGVEIGLGFGAGSLAKF